MSRTSSVSGGCNAVCGIVSHVWMWVHLLSINMCGLESINWNCVILTLEVYSEMLIILLNYREHDGRTLDLAAGESSMMSVHTTKLWPVILLGWWRDKCSETFVSSLVHLRIIVSDFIDEVSGFVWDSQDEACLQAYLETNREGYLISLHRWKNILSNSNSMFHPTTKCPTMH